VHGSRGGPYGRGSKVEKCVSSRQSLGPWRGVSVGIALPVCQIEDCPLEALSIAVNARQGMIRQLNRTLVSEPSETVSVAMKHAEWCGKGCQRQG
jgi:hypothetical protein